MEIVTHFIFLGYKITADSEAMKLRETCLKNIQATPAAQFQKNK